MDIAEAFVYDVDGILSEDGRFVTVRYSGSVYIADTQEHVCVAELYNAFNVRFFITANYKVKHIAFVRWFNKRLKSLGITDNTIHFTRMKNGERALSVVLPVDKRLPLTLPRKEAKPKTFDSLRGCCE